MRYVVCVGKVEALGYLDVLECLDICSFLFTSLAIPARHGEQWFNHHIFDFVYLMQTDLGDLLLLSDHDYVVSHAELDEAE